MLVMSNTIIAGTPQKNHNETVTKWKYS